MATETATRVPRPAATIAKCGDRRGVAGQDDPDAITEHRSPADKRRVRAGVGTLVPGLVLFAPMAAVLVSRGAAERDLKTLQADGAGGAGYVPVPPTHRLVAHAEVFRCGPGSPRGSAACSTSRPSLSVCTRSARPPRHFAARTRSNSGVELRLHPLL